MKQPKKRWAWTAHQRGRIAAARCWHNSFHQPPKWFVKIRWHRHRSQTRQALHQLLAGADETVVFLPRHHKNAAHWDWT